MRVLVAPDAFSGTLSAPEAARAIALGWHRTSPHDELLAMPMSDGGPGFTQTVHAVVGGDLDVLTVPDLAGRSTPMTLLRSGDTAYLEAAQATGPHFTEGVDPWDATSVGVGRAIGAAVSGGAATVVVGLGGTATLDGGAGLLAGLGATADVPLDRGPRALRGIGSIDLETVRTRLDGVRLVAAVDVDLPLLGMFGTTRATGADLGLDDGDVVEVDGVLDAWVDVVCGTSPSQRRVADAKGAGAAGGQALALALLGAELRPGVELVGDVVGLDAACAAHDLVVSGEGRYDHTSRAGKVVHGVAARSAARARPCIVLAGEVTVGSREMRAMGVESAYGTVDLLGRDRALLDPAAALADLAERVARTWAR